MPKVTLKPLPVVYACQGCAEYGQSARDLGAELEKRGVAEMVWLGGPATPKHRYPTIALDGCAKGCARAWLEQRGLIVDQSCVLARC